MTLLCNLRKTSPQEKLRVALTGNFVVVGNAEGRPCIARIRGVIIWLVNFYCARTGLLFLLYEGHYVVAT